MVAHLLRRNDWTETHNFPDDAKVQRFCLTLTGEARLWYETLRPIQIDWTALEEHFRQQYSKFGSTREQYFHVWRSFHYDENVETVDAYANRITQVAALLGYGEPQILEVFKNTVHSRLYWILYTINELRVAVETAKRVLSKEKIDKQRMGQSSTSPFMKVSQESIKNCEKGVSFGALETTERNSHRIDKLTSLINKMNMKMDRRETQYGPRVYQGTNRGCSNRQDNYRSRERSYGRDHAHYNRRRGNHTNRDYRSNYRARSRSRNSYGNRINDRFDNRQSYRRENFRQEHGEQIYRTRSKSQDHDRSRQRLRDSSRSKNQYGRDQTSNRDRRPRSESRSRSSSHVSTNRDRLRCYRCSEYDHFARECPNALMEGDSDQEDLDSATLQMLSQDDSCNYAEMEG